MHHPSYTQRFVSNHDYTSHRIGFWKNIYVILVAHSSLFAKNVKKFPRKCRNWATCHPGRVKTCMYNSFDINSPWSENFIPVKTGGVSSPRSEFFFSFLVLNTVRGLTRHRVEFNPGRSFSCKKALRILKFYFKLEVLISLRENCPYSELFWPAFFRIWTE